MKSRLKLLQLKHQLRDNITTLVEALTENRAGFRHAARALGGLH